MRFARRADRFGIKFTILALLLAALAVPPDALVAFAGQEQGPVKPPAQPGQKEPQKKPEYSIQVQTNVVNVDTVVTDQDGNILTGLKQANFRITDDNVPQTITNFAPTDEPITIVLLLEFSNIYYGYISYWGKYLSYGFADHLGPKDWVALVTFDLRPHIVVDFTRNKGEIQNAIAGLYFPGFSETNLFDALIDTLDRLKDVKGKKSILVMATGFDTFSKHTLDQTYNLLKRTDVTVFCIGVADDQIESWDARGLLSSSQMIGYLQAKNELSTFGRLTGGYTWFPRFEGEMPSIFNSVVAMLRNQYALAYSPTGVPQDGKYHKIKVQVVNPDGSPMFVVNKKGKKKKIIVYAREGYMAPKAAASD